jgi:hypothetical protein
VPRTALPLTDKSHNPLLTIFNSTILDTLLVGVPPLSTVWQAPTGCQSNWVYAPSTADTTTGPTTIFSAFSRDPNYLDCQPYCVTPTYSPGVCPEGQTVLEVTELQSTGSDGVAATHWLASCCRRSQLRTRLHVNPLTVQIVAWAGRLRFPRHVSVNFQNLLRSGQSQTLHGITIIDLPPKI